MKKIVSLFGDQSDTFIKLNSRAAQYAKERGIEYICEPQLSFDRDDVIAQLSKADAGIIDVQPFGDETFPYIKGGAKLLVRFGVGYDKVDLDSATRHGIAIARTTGANTLGVAEMALTLILSVKRRILENVECVNSGQWERNVAHETIGSTIGILGFGSIGKALAKLLTGFECRIITYDPYIDPRVIFEHGVESVTLEELLKQSDVISMHIPYSAENHHIIGKEALKAMKSNSIVINTARGNLIDETALYEALSNGTIAGAGLDVFAEEPLAANSPLSKLKNVVLTPHVSSQTVESLWRIYKMAIDISADFFSGKGSEHILNPI